MSYYNDDVLLDAPKLGLHANELSVHASYFRPHAGQFRCNTSLTLIHISVIRSKALGLDTELLLSRLLDILIAGHIVMLLSIMDLFLTIQVVTDLLMMGLLLMCLILTVLRIMGLLVIGLLLTRVYYGKDVIGSGERARVSGGDMTQSREALFSFIATNLMVTTLCACIKKV